MKLSVLIPARNEEKSIRQTVVAIAEELQKASIVHEILVVNDNSSDQTEVVLKSLGSDFPTVRYINSENPPGYGFAVRQGLKHYEGDAVCIVMGDGSDHPADIRKYYEKLEEGYECVFGSRFIKGSWLVDYPLHKLFLNRLANYFIKFLFRLPYNDVTNAFKCYRRQVIEATEPLLSNHFNLTVELPLKAIVRGYRYAVVPIGWTNRQQGISKLKIKEMGSRYLFIVLSLFLEKTLSRGDYRRKDKG